MNHAHHAAPDATHLALAATRHCLTGCAIGEVLGLLVSGALGFAIVVMETVDNLVVLLVPVAFAATFPVNRWLIVRGRGHALAHGGHG